MEHTQGEWAVGFSDQGLGHGTYGVMVKNTAKVVIMDLTKNEAEKIVLRWNSQPDLLAACEAMAEYISEQWSKEWENRPNCLRMGEDAITKATQ